MQLLTFAALVVAAASSPVPSQKVIFLSDPLAPLIFITPVVTSCGPIFGSTSDSLLFNFKN